MTEQLAMFDPSPYQAPAEVLADQAAPAAMSAGQRRTMRVAIGIALGHHPMGGPTRPELGTCGNCANLRRAEYHGKHYLKCALTRWTHGPGSDVRRKWPACHTWLAVTGPQEGATVSE